jgi:hypothetical protein
MKRICLFFKSQKLIQIPSKKLTFPLKPIPIPIDGPNSTPTGSTSFIFELGQQARPGRQTGIRLYWPVPAEGQNKSWGHRLKAKAITYQARHLNNK